MHLNTSSHHVCSCQQRLLVFAPSHYLCFSIHLFYLRMLLHQLQRISSTSLVATMLKLIFNVFHSKSVSLKFNFLSSLGHLVNKEKIGTSTKDMVSVTPPRLKKFGYLARVSCCCLHEESCLSPPDLDKFFLYLHHDTWVC
jgi:hypothetical protein